MPITGMILDVAARHPDRPAIVGSDGRLTYAQLVDDSRRMFAAVDALHRSQPVPPRPAAETGGIPITAVSITSAFHTARIVAGLAGFRTVSATIDPRWPLEHRVRVILTCGIGVVISDSTALQTALIDAGWTGTVLSLAEFMRREAYARPRGMPRVRDSREAFLLLFSSGTTSNPKAFLKTRGQYRANYAISSAHLEPLPGVATFAPGPISYSLTLYAVIESLASGGSVHVADAFEPAAVGGRIRDERITRVVAVPAVVQSLADAARRDPAAFERLALVVTGGANLSSVLRDELARVLPEVRLISYYGAAEIGFIGDSRGGDGTRIAVYDGVEVAIRDEVGAPVADGELGTLWVRAEACSDGYLAATTREVLREPDGWATVHDQGRLVPDTPGTPGGLELVGRAGDIAVTGGHKVSLQDVDRAFEGMPQLGAVSAVAVPHTRLGTVVALVIEKNGAATPAKAQLQAWAREKLAPQYVPRRWYVVPALPRTVGGKIRRGETAELIARGEAERL
ncbi:class I adenylate-forming enzyme family protein [Microbacterium sp.]|uniref:class I adenylate-forming enzyme family protein n=1 Tax=Microbacterium sp. TaxID=51671 RepID=UPI003A909A3F